ncbi:hypothetical protein BDW67DRAFT_179534 [Aspergillus spinulosporus]
MRLHCKAAAGKTAIWPPQRPTASQFTALSGAEASVRLVKSTLLSLARKNLSRPRGPTSVHARDLRNTFFVWAAGQNPLWNDDAASRPTVLVYQLWNTSYAIGLSFDDGIQTLILMVSDHRFYGVSGGEHNHANGVHQIAHRTDRPLCMPGDVEYQCLQLPQRRQLNHLLPERNAGVSNRRPLAQFHLQPPQSQCRKHHVDVLDLTSRKFYQYGEGYLILAYTTAIGATVACITVRFFALRRSGVSQSTSFSSVLMTTRNPELDCLAVGHCLGAEPLKKEIGKVRLQYGEIECPDSGISTRRLEPREW